jgi:hypothetical protein
MVDLPISGNFVEMLRRLVQLSRNQGTTAAGAEGKPASLAPFRMISADGRIVPPSPDARPLIRKCQGALPVTLRKPTRPLWFREGVLPTTC